MWRKYLELKRLKALRIAALEAMAGEKPFSSRVELKIGLHSNKQDGDLDSFIVGICDGLMAARPLTPESGRPIRELAAAELPCDLGWDRRAGEPSSGRRLDVPGEEENSDSRHPQLGRVATIALRKESLRPLTPRCCGDPW